MLKIGSKIDEIRIDGSLEALRRDLRHYVAIEMEAAEIPVHGLDVIKNGFLDRDRMEEVRRILGGVDLEYSVHAPNPLNLMEQESPELHLSVFRASLAFAAAIGAKVLVYHAGRFIPEETFPVAKDPRLSKEDASLWMEREREYLARLSEEYPDILICIENARPYLHYSPYCYAEAIDHLKEQVETVNRPNVKINLDVGHLYMASRFYQFDPVQAVKNIQSLIAHTHIHDNFGGAVYPHEKTQTHQIPFGRGDGHMPVGWGGIPLAEILSAYIPPYEGMLMMELRSRYFSRTEESGANLVRLLESLPIQPDAIGRTSVNKPRWAGSLRPIDAGQAPPIEPEKRRNLS